MTDTVEYPEPTKEQWVAALRSGKYKQCQGVLKDRAGAYCCIGVLSELWGTDLDAAPVSLITSALINPSYSKRIDLSWLTVSQRGRAADKNDAGASFEEIADWIEAGMPLHGDQLPGAM